MLSKELKTELRGVRFELIDLNKAVYFYVRKINRLTYLFKETTRAYILEELHAIRYLENGIILHLTNLDDDNANYSFKKIQKELNKQPTDSKALKLLQTELKTYRREINNLKNNHRNSRIAHLNSLEFPNLDEFLDFKKELKPLIKKANLIGDMIWGEQIQVKFKLGSLEGIIDYRSEFEKLEIDLEKEQSFT